MDTINKIQQINNKNLKEYEKYGQMVYNKRPHPDNIDRFQVAPMLEITNKYWRFLARLLTKKATLWTEMIHQDCILFHKDGYKNVLDYLPCENKLVLQIGGNDPEKLRKCAILAEQMGYDEVNLNVGCPSDRVQDGKFGAVLMKEPLKVAECMKAMQDAVKIPCTVKCRLGVDNFDSYDFIKDFIDVVSKNSQTRHFIIHARKAILKGLSPSENRNIPPLQYEKVYQLMQDFSHIKFSINGGFKTFEQIKEQLELHKVHGVMVGRASYENIWMLGDVDRQIYNESNQGLSRRQILNIWAEYGQQQIIKEKVNLATINKPIINLFNGENHSNKYRQYLSDPKNYHNLNNDYVQFIQQAILIIAKFNLEALDQVHPQL